MRETYLDVSSAPKKCTNTLSPFRLSKESHALLSSCYLWYGRQCIYAFKLTNYDPHTLKTGAHGMDKFLQCGLKLQVSEGRRDTHTHAHTFCLV